MSTVRVLIVDDGPPFRDAARAVIDSLTGFELVGETESGEDGVVGVNKYTAKEETPISTLKIDFRAQRKQLERIRRVKAQRDNRKVETLLDKLQKSYENPEANSMYPLLDAVTAYATLGEIITAGREIFGTFKEPQIL